MASDWVTPDSNVPNGWEDPANAHDDNTTTHADCNIPKSSWGAYLELWLDKALRCSKVRIYSKRNSTDVNFIEVGVYYGGTWHVIYTGTFTVNVYVEYEIGSEQIVTAMRMRYQNWSGSFARKAYVYEADFYGDYPAGGSRGFLIG
jgi:hypothetical protein